MTEAKKAGRTSPPTAPNEPSWVEPRSGTEAELLELAENLRQAELSADVPFLERVLTADFVGIGPRGFVLNKEAWLGRHRSGDLKYESIERDDMALRTYTDAAILTAREIGKTFYKGQEVSVGALRATYTFVRRGGNWRLAGVQFSPIMGAP
jgi:hypothetical protein